MIIDVNSDYDIIKWKRNSEEWKIAPLEELIDCFDKYTWIPVSEMLPEKNGKYLVTNSAGEIFDVDWNAWVNGEWLFPNSAPIAWMPLPEPYRGDADE